MPAKRVEQSHDIVVGSGSVQGAPRFSLLGGSSAARESRRGKEEAAALQAQAQVQQPPPSPEQEDCVARPHAAAALTPVATRTCEAGAGAGAGSSESRPHAGTTQQQCADALTASAAAFGTDTATAPVHVSVGAPASAPDATHSALACSTLRIGHSILQQGTREPTSQDHTTLKAGGWDLGRNRWDTRAAAQHPVLQTYGFGLHSERGPDQTAPVSQWRGSSPWSTPCAVQGHPNTDLHHGVLPMTAQHPLHEGASSRGIKDASSQCGRRVSSSAGLLGRLAALKKQRQQGAALPGQAAVTAAAANAAGQVDPDVGSAAAPVVSGVGEARHCLGQKRVVANPTPHGVRMGTTASEPPCHTRSVFDLLFDL
jgi:hypothetical protein